MNYTYELTRLHQFVREIYANCRQNTQAAAGRFVVSKSLIAKGLSGLADSDIDTLLESLEFERYIQPAGNGQLVFPATLIEQDSWINNYAYYNA